MKNILSMMFSIFFVVSASFATAKTPLYLNPVAKNGVISIKKTELSKDATFVNYKVGDVTVQLIAVIADDNTYRISFNTCQSCNPSPKAYFVQKGKKLICQNCGNQFIMNDVGSASYGCNPARIPFKENSSEIFVSTDVLEKASPAFRKWQGKTE